MFVFLGTKNNDCINASENEGNSSNDDDLSLKLQRGASQIKSEQSKSVDIIKYCVS